MQTLLEIMLTYYQLQTAHGHWVLIHTNGQTSMQIDSMVEHQLPVQLIQLQILVILTHQVQSTVQY